MELELLGTVLLAKEGINLYVAGCADNIEAFKMFLNQWEEFKGLSYKESVSCEKPYEKMRVKIKNEIISFGVSKVMPAKHTAPYLSPQEFKQWYDEGRDMIVLDARNAFEVRYGTFRHAKHLNLENFSDFPEALTKLDPSFKNKPIIAFCTGGIRCEKAAEYMLQQGFQEVYQLAGGILNYFAECKDAYFHGKCFVFDNRVSVKPD